MDKKLALVDYIEGIKEKITDKEYKDILELLSSIKVQTTNQTYQRTDSEDSEDSRYEERERQERQEREERIRQTIPNIQIKLYTSTGIIEENARTVWLRQTGFAQPAKISRQLANFIGISEDVFISRSDITKAITKYIKDHDLQKPENRRIIDLNKPGGQQLRELLAVHNDVELTFFNLQRYLKIHFIPWSI